MMGVHASELLLRRTVVKTATHEQSTFGVIVFKISYGRPRMKGAEHWQSVILTAESSEKY